MLNETFFMIFGDLTSWFLVILREIWLFLVTFDDYWWFFMIKTGDLSWLIMIHHDWSWQITIQLGEGVGIHIENSLSGIEVQRVGKIPINSIQGLSHQQTSMGSTF